MFKPAIIFLIEMINNMILSTGSDDVLTATIYNFNPTLYSYIVEIMHIVIMPVAYTILALFFVLELHKASLKIDGSGGGTTLGSAIIFKLLLRLVLCKFAIDKSKLILQAIYNVSIHLTQGVSGILTNGSSTSGIDMEPIKEVINNMNIALQIASLIIIIVVTLAIAGTMIFIKVIVVARFIEIYIHLAFAPIPLATFPSEGLSNIGINFLKSFTAVSIQGTFIFIVFSFYPYIYNSKALEVHSSWGIFGALFSLLGYAIVLAIGVFNCNRWAKSICNAM